MSTTTRSVEDRLGGTRDSGGPTGTVRYGAFCEPGVIVMPGFVNIGARVGSGTMVDTWATVGPARRSAGTSTSRVASASAACWSRQGAPGDHRGRSVHRQPLDRRRRDLRREEAVFGANTVLTASTPIIDVTGSEPVEHRGQVPARRGGRARHQAQEFPSGTYDSRAP